MRVEIALETTDSSGRTFLGWSPVKGTAQLTDAAGIAAPVRITLQNGGAAGGGQVWFSLQRTESGSAHLQLDLPPDGGKVEFWTAGEFQHPSSDYGDAAIEAVEATAGPVGRRELMVRIRKNAVKLTPAERDRFLAALGKLNDAGQGPFQSFRDTHVQQSIDEAHGFPGFPPWHRAYLLDLERNLQQIDPSVALPYWRFDEPAPALFASEFLGMPPADPSQGDVIQFPHGHALEFWKTDGSDPIARRPLYPIAGAPPQTVPTPQGDQPFVISQQDTLALGADYANFRQYEIAPHGCAHTSFNGPINSVPTAAKDPLFFLLHANVDRLWAFWQWLNHRHDATNDPQAYSLAGPQREPDDIGHKLADTMWPWNGDTNPPRPTFPPPRGQFPNSPVVGQPPSIPAIRDMIDYQGVYGGGALGFDYDDVPFELPAGAPAA